MLVSTGTNKLMLADLRMRQTRSRVAEVEHTAGVLPHVWAPGAGLGVPLSGQVFLDLIVTVRLIQPLLLHHLNLDEGLTIQTIQHLLYL